MPVSLICDSSCNVPESYQQSLGIIQVPAWINFADGSSLRNGIDISDADFYDRLIHEKHLPTTSQPTPQDFLDAFANIPAENDIILASVAAKLSGTHNSCVQACMMAPDRSLHAYDTESASMGAGWQVIAGAELAARGADLQTVLDGMVDARNRINTVFAIDTLKYLAASGRAPTLQAMVGTLLSIKPILRIDDSQLEVVGRARGRKKSLRELIERIATEANGRPARVAVVNANCHDEAIEFSKELSQDVNVAEMLVVELGPVLGALAGPGTIAVGAFAASAASA